MFKKTLNFLKSGFKLAYHKLARLLSKFKITFSKPRLTTTKAIALVLFLAFYGLTVSFVVNVIEAEGACSSGDQVQCSGTTLTNLTLDGPLKRGGHAVGFLEGSYNNIGANSAKSNPIYTIGSSYNPGDATIGNMYGIGYSHDNFWYNILGEGEFDAGWGFYVAADGNVRATISGSNGDIWSARDITAVGAITGATINTGYGAKEIGDTVGNCAAADVHKGNGGCEAESSLSVSYAGSAGSAGSVPLSGITYGPTYAHLGAWGVGRTDNNTVLVNTAYRADIASGAGNSSACSRDGTCEVGALAATGAISVDGNTVIDDGAGWHRSYGNTGWYNGTHGGGWYMTDATWIRAYNNKSVVTSGTMQAGTYTGGGCDIAERYEASKDSNELEPGDIVIIDSEEEMKIKKSDKAYSSLVIGMISTNPSMTMGVIEGTEDHPPVALLGRVPTKVTTENGVINIGDYIVSSSKAGYGMKCDDFSKCRGAIIGKALQGLEGGEGMIEVLIDKM